MNLLITGANGFVGRNVTKALHSEAVSFKAALKLPSESLPPTVPSVIVGMIDNKTEWSRSLEGIDTVVHLAAHAHAAPGESDKQFYAVNYEGTERLARQAKAAGVKHFIYLSSVSSVARSSAVPLTETMTPRPETPYAESKFLGEEVVRGEFSNERWSIFRAPALFGAGCRGNLQSLLMLCQRGLFLPFPDKSLIRSFLNVTDVARAIQLRLQSSERSGELFHLSDDGTPPLREVIEFMQRSVNGAHVTGKIKIHPGWLKAAGKVGDLLSFLRISKSFSSHRMVPLTEPLLVSSEKAQRQLGWKPQKSFEDGLREWLRFGNSVKDYRSDPES